MREKQAVHELSKNTRFRALHRRGSPLVLFNIWDVGSAKAVEEAGAQALATGSWSVAAANGFSDGEHVPLEMTIENARRIANSTTLPVSLDIESGYGTEPAQVGKTLTRVAQVGVVGCNIEDSVPGDGTLRPIAEQVARLRSARLAVDASCPDFFINARTDLFFQLSPEQHGLTLADNAIERARAYAEAGADGIFVPGLIDEGLIAHICSATMLPVNVMIGDTSPPLDRLGAAGVARISYGAGPYLGAMRALRDAAAAAMQLLP